MLTVVVTIEPQPDQRDALEAALTDLLAQVRAEPGCAGIYWGRPADGTSLVIVERYHDEAALQAHHATAHMQHYGPIIGGLVASAPTAVMFQEF